MSLSMKTRISPDEKSIPAVLPGQGFHLVKGSVRAAVIHKDDFRIGQAFQRFFQGRKKIGEALFFVIDWYDYA